MNGTPSVRVIVQQCLSATLQVHPPGDDVEAQSVEVSHRLVFSVITHNIKHKNHLNKPPNDSKGKGAYFMRVTLDSPLELLINLWPLVCTFHPLPLSMLRFTGIQSYSYTEQRKVKTDVDQMTGIKLMTLQLRRLRTND